MSGLFSWTKERRVLLVKSFEKKKWVVVRPLPFSRTYPQQYDVSPSLIIWSETALKLLKHTGAMEDTKEILFLFLGMWLFVKAEETTR